MKYLVLIIIFSGLCLLSNAQNIQSLNDFPKYITPEMVKMMRENGTYEKQRKELRDNCDLSLHDKPGREWQKEIVLCKFLCSYDKEFYDQVNNRIRVKEIAAEGKERYGGYDEILLWPTYPRLGIDERNQFDFYRQLPGGKEGVKKMIEEFHKYGIRISFAYNPWDIGTRREGRPDAEVMAELFSELGVDGLFLDTMTEGDSTFTNTILTANPNLRFYPETADKNKEVEINTGVFHKGLDPQKIYTQRWISSTFNPLIAQAPISDEITNDIVNIALFHGYGCFINEGIFGKDYPYTDRDAAMIKDMIYIQRQYMDFYRSNAWNPFIATEDTVLLAHQWQNSKNSMFTIYNNSDKDYEGDLVRVQLKGEKEFIDIWNNKKVIVTKDEGQFIISGKIKAGEVAVLVPLSSNENNWKPNFREMLVTPRAISVLELTKVDKTEPLALNEITPDMALVKGGDYLRTVRHNSFGNIQGRCYGDIAGQTLEHHGLDFITITPFAMDKTEVTNAQFLEFLTSSGYIPQDTTNFLAHWIKPGAKISSWKIPSGFENHPVVYVDLNDARAYAKWAGKRIPTEAEWQYAAEGPNNDPWPWNEEIINDELMARDAKYYRWGLCGRKWPWGEMFDPVKCNGNNKGTMPVGSFPEGQSVWGIDDLAGNVWEWTESEYSDGHNRFVIIKGGSYFVSKGSYWYTASGPQPNQTHEKFLLTFPGLDRCSTVGFRCVKDVVNNQEIEKDDISKDFTLE